MIFFLLNYHGYLLLKFWENRIFVNCYKGADGEKVIKSVARTEYLPRKTYTNAR